jgi:two-component system, cell cycle sensor histidine kinase and response regulator CckA
MNISVDVSGRSEDRRFSWNTVCCAFLLFCIIIAVSGTVSGAAVPERKEVLYINSYSKGLEWSDSVTQAVEDRMRTSGYEVNLHVEYMDEKRFQDPAYESMLADFYRYKYADYRFDVIIVSDDNAFAFIKKYREDIFPETPVVFCGVNFFSDDMLAGQTNITGVVEQYNIKDTLATALHLQPSIRHIYVINDRSKTGAANKKNIELVTPEFSSRADITFLEDYSMAELEAKVATLPENSLILLMTFNQDRLGADYSYDESIRRIRAHANVPVYGIWEFYLGKGIVGGMLTSGYEQGNLSAQIATRILQGESPSQIPVIKNPPNRYMFDNAELSRFGIRSSDLPSGSIVINQPVPVRILSESVIWAIGISATGLILGLAAMVIAFLRLRRIRDALDESERRYRAVVEDQTELICRIRKDGTHIFVNDAYCRYFGKTRSEILGTKFIPDMSTEEKRKVKIHLASLTPIHPIGSTTNQLEMPGKGKRWLKWNNHAIFDDTGSVSEYQSVGRDVTDVQLAEDELRSYQENLEELIDTRTQELVMSNAQLQQEVAERTIAEDLLAEEKERLAVTLRSIGEGVITTDIAGRVLLVNGVAERLTGWKQKYAAGCPVTQVLSLIDEKTRTPVENPALNPANQDSGSHIPFRALLVARDGTERFIEESASIMSDHENRAIGFVIVFRDITERQKLENELARTQKLESLGLLAGGIAHDFNNILTALFGNIILARMHMPADSPGYERLAEAEHAMVRAKELTQQLLTFSKGGAPVKETADITGIIIDSTKFMLRGSQSRCEYTISPSLWTVDVDVGQISQVINNIVINADQAMSGGGIIQVSATNCTLNKGTPLPLPPGRYVKITIADNGQGIPKENLARIFDPYFTTKEKGSGLGLSTALSIIRKHSGHIEIGSERGTGTTVHIYLPASDKGLNESVPGNDQPVHGSGRILVMDDEEAILDMASALLSHFGYHPSVAHDGEEAIALYLEAAAKNDPFAVVIMDLTIPGGLGGKETIARLREVDPQIKAVVSSGYSTDPIVANFLQYGFSGILTKPYTAKEMSEVIKKVLSAKKEKI